MASLSNETTHASSSAETNGSHATEPRIRHLRLDTLGGRNPAMPLSPSKAPEDRSPRGLSRFLASKTGASSSQVEAYIDSLRKDGVNCLALLSEKTYTSDDLKALGFKPEHVALIFCGLEEYQATKWFTPSLSTLLPKPPQHPKEDLIRLIHSTPCDAKDPVGRDHPLLEAAGLPGLENTDTCQALLKLLDAFEGDEHVVLSTLSALCRHTCNKGQRTLHADRRRRLGQRGACEILINVLTTYSSEPAIVAAALNLLLYLAREDRNARRLGAAGACELVCKAMHRFPTDPRVQLFGFRAVKNLVVHEGNDNIRKLCSAGAAELTCAAMKSFPTDRDVQWYGCGVIANLALDPMGKRWLGSGGACESVCAALRTFPEDADVQEDGCAAVQRLSWGTEDNKRRLGQAGGCELVTAALTRYPNVKEIQMQACLGVMNLALTEENRRRLVAAEVRPRLDRIVMSYKADAHLSKKAREAIDRLAPPVAKK